ncbi:GyrI-like domain-containing protein [Zhihengliuella flava]|uniref:GyrI-like small molecule binding domain-containing protein n=1 Tax=Zhihengliuella flava TaxID=1285193 RepID=A0A931D9C3_9MICC|nr:hypothetical protein [Zhihengliuella flava]
MTKIDFKKTIDAYRAPRGRFERLEVPAMRYLMLDGHGDPNTSPLYAASLAALYPTGYAVKFASKEELGRDYVVPPLEGLWWADSMDSFTTARDKSAWKWTLLLMVPEWIDHDLVNAAAARARTRAAAKRGMVQAALERMGEIRLETLTEGDCVQTLHVGPYDDEAATLARLHHEFIPDQGLRMTGRHHEVYLSDPRRVPPERLRTILRQPVTHQH